MSHWHSSEFLLARDRIRKRFFSPNESATYIVAAVIPPIIAPSGSCGVSDYCPCHGANQATGDRGARRTAGQPTNQGACAAADHGAPRNTVLPPICASSERQCHRYHSHCSTHLLRPATNDSTPSQASDSPETMVFGGRKI